MEKYSYGWWVVNSSIGSMTSNKLIIIPDPFLKWVRY